MMHWVDQENNLQICVPDYIWDEMTQLCAGSYPNECGGILIGEYSNSMKQAKIRKIMVSKNSTSGRMDFLREATQTNNFLKKLWYFASGTKYFIGEWHSHPNGTGTPSSLDDASMYKVAKTVRCRCKRPILFILNGGPETWYADSCWVYLSEGKRVGLIRDVGV